MIEIKQRELKNIPFMPPLPSPLPSFRRPSLTTRAVLTSPYPLPRGRTPSSSQP
uniref:Cxpwmw05 n=1 Tax=Periplaneta americana TaxID=6978 RepID=Q1PS49_PERAM|nr:cxpwmw05 [Periplaneta americana]